jgi:hypothetical protein
MAVGYVIHQGGVTVIVEQPCLDAGNVLSQPFAVGRTGTAMSARSNPHG